MRWLLAFLLFAAPAYAEEAHPDQWQYEESLEVPPGPIPRDRCIRALYLTDELREERGVPHGEWWEPPITDQMVRWLSWHRERAHLSLSFCDSGGDT